MADAAVIREADARRREYWAVRPEPMTHTAFARTLTVPDSEDEHGRQDPYDPRSHPGQWHVVQALDGLVNGDTAPRKYRRFLLITDAQGGGKSWLLQQVIFHGTIELGNDVIWALPTKGMAGDLWNLKLRPSWEGAGLGVYLPTTGSGSRGSSSPRSVRTRRFNGRGGGTLVFMSSGGRGQSGQAGLTAKRLAVDELSDWDKAAFTRIRKRVSRWNDVAVEIYGSTLKLDDGDLTLATYEESTRARVEYRCCHCQGWTPFLWKTWAGGDDPHVVCIACGVHITETNRKAMMAEHRLSQEEPGREVFGIMLTALDCPWKSFAWLASGEASAKAAELRVDYEPMRTFYHDERVEAYQEPEPEGEFSERALVANSSRSTYEKRMVPAWAGFLVLTQDVQGDRHYWLLVAHGGGDRWAIVDWGYELLVPYGKDGKPLREPTPVDRVKVFDLIRDKANEGWQVEGGERRMRPVQRGVDCGYLPSEVVGWVQGNPDWKAVRGVGHDEIKHQSGGHEKYLPEEIRQTKALQAVKPPGWRVYWWRVDGDRFRRSGQASLMRDADQVASGMLPRGLKANDAIVLHLSALQWVTPTEDDRKSGSKKGLAPYWFEKRVRHDWGDCLDYNLALALLHRHAPDARDEEPEPAPAPVHQPSSSWVDSVVDGRGGESWINS
jgi:phage terminase large subunit GpA-like protein